MADSGQSDKNTVKPGDTLKQWRKKHRLTLAEVSRRTGLPVSTLSKVENHQLSLSYERLSRLSEGLGIDISYFFGAAEPVGAPEAQVSGRRSVIRKGEGAAIKTDAYDHLYAAPELLNKHFVPIVMEVRARSLDEFGDLVSHSGEEYTMVLTGELELRTELYTPLRLQVGDAIYFDSSMGHAYLNAGKGVCRVLSVCSATEAHLRAVLTGESPGTDEDSAALPRLRVRRAG